MQYYLGLDVHSKKTSYCLQEEGGSVKAQGEILSTREAFAELKKRLSIPDGTKVALESGAQARFTVGLLHELELTPVVINAFEVRRKARRIGQKTDSRDAFELCDGLRRDIYDSIVYIPEPRIARIRAVLSRRRHYVKLATMETNAAKFVLRSSGLGALARSLKTDRAWKKLIEDPRLPEEIRGDIRRHSMTWQHTQLQIAELVSELEVAVKPFVEDVDRLRTVPGVGPLTAATFFSTLGTVDRFADSNRVVSYLGLAPSMNDSGAKERHGGITKRGSSAARTILCEVAHHAARKDHPLNPYFARQCAKHGLKRAVVGVAARLARILYQMWRKRSTFDVTKLNIEHVIVERVEKRYRVKSAEMRKASVVAIAKIA